MATPTPPPPPVTPAPSEPAIIEETVTVVPTADRQFVSSPIGWSSILAATVITLGVWLALHLFGIGVGMTAIDPKDAGSLRGAGIGVGIWSVVAPIVALFIGGLVAGRVAPTINTLNAVIHGAVVWALSLLVTMLVLSMMFNTLARGVVSAGSTVTTTAGAALEATGGGVSLEALGLDADDLFAPINRELEQRGMSPIAPEDARAAAQEALQTAIRQGGLDREQAIDILDRRTDLSREDAEQLAAALETNVEAAMRRSREVVVHVTQAALGAAESLGKALLALFALMVLGLGAAIGGSILSVRRERRTHVHLPRATSRTTA